MYKFTELYKNDKAISMSAEAEKIWSMANILRGVYLPSSYGEVIIPFTVLRRFECILEPTKDLVLEYIENNPDKLQYLNTISGYQFHNKSRYNLKLLLNDQENIADNFKDYINGFSDNVKSIFGKGAFEIDKIIDKLNDNKILYNTVKSISELDLSISKFDSIKMGHIFEHLIGKWYENIDQGQFYTARDIIRLMVSLLINENIGDMLKGSRVVKICDQACGTGGMLSTAYDCLKKINSNLNIQLFGQEFNGSTYGIGLSEMLIKDQDSEHFVHTDTLKHDMFPDDKMDLIIENPPFGTPWKGEHSKEGQEEAVIQEFEKDAECRVDKILTGGEFKGRWGAGLTDGGESQLLFMQSAISKLKKTGRMAIIENGSPLFNNAKAGSGESNIRLWLLKSDLIEAIIQMPNDMFYNTGITTYIWIISKNKRAERKGKIQLINASEIYHKLRKNLGNKKNEFSLEDVDEITKIYTDFKESDICKIMNNEDFMFREYAVMEPKQRVYQLNKENIEKAVNNGALKKIYSEAEIDKLLEEMSEYNSLDEKEKKKKKSKSLESIQGKIEAIKANKPKYDNVLNLLYKGCNGMKYNNDKDFKKFLKTKLTDIEDSVINNLVKNMYILDKSATVEKDAKGNIVYDTDTKEIENVPFGVDIDDYMASEVLPFVPDAKAFNEEKLTGKDPKIKLGAQIPFTKIFYKYEAPIPSTDLLNEIKEIEESIENLLEEF